MSYPSNPAQLLRIPDRPDLQRLLRACGGDEACLTGVASDYDQFLTLAEAMPLCAGHPLQAEVNTRLWESTGLHAPLCPHTARLFWETWAEIHWYGTNPQPPTPPAVCPHCQACTPHYLSAETCSPLPNPLTRTAENLGAWSKGLEVALSEAGDTPLLALPPDYAFVRPDPYHANQAVTRLFEGQTLSSDEENLLLTQALRVWGQRATKGKTRVSENPKNPTGKLYLQGGEGSTIAALLAYLQASKALPPMVWLPQDPAEAGQISGLYPCVGTGLNLTDCDPPEAETRLARYAASAPLGRAVMVVGR